MSAARPTPGNNSEFTFNDVLTRGLCIGCGACPFVAGGDARVALSPDGVYSATTSAPPNPEQLDELNKVCPIADAAANESELGAVLYGDLPADPIVGHHLGSYAARVTDEAQLVRSSSGGVTTWVLQQLLSGGVVDGVIHVKPAAQPRADGALAEYAISRTVEDLEPSRTSRYQSTTMAEALTAVHGDGQRYALVGVPCFIKAARLLAGQEPDFADSFAVTIGLVCGHMKGTMFGQSIGWQAGVELPRDLADLTYRVKNPTRQVGSYDAAATDKQADRHVIAMRDTIDGNWGFGAFQPEACNFCDDIFAEAANMVVADAWLPKYRLEWRGTSLVVSRTAELDALLREGAEAGELWLEPTPLDDVIESQGGNVRHRRVGLAVRLADDIAAGLQVPTKRVSPGYDGVDAKRISLIRQRRLLSRLSFAAFRDAVVVDNLDLYAAAMRKPYARYRATTGTRWRTLASRALATGPGQLAYRLLTRLRK